MQHLITAGRILAAAGVLLAAFYGLFDLDGYPGVQRPLVALWAAAPLPVAYWLGRKLARTTASLAIVVAGLALACASAAWFYWDATYGPSSRSESLAGLIFVLWPLYQYAGLAIVLVIAWLAGKAMPAKEDAS
jgi:hypothetical protein